MQARMAGCLGFINHLSVGVRGRPSLQPHTASREHESELFLRSLSHQSPPVSERLLAVYAPLPAWPCICCDPQTAFSFGDPQHSWKTGLFILPGQPRGGVSSAHSVGTPSGPLARVLQCCAWTGCLICSKRCIIKHRSIFLLTENLNIYRL